jgi:hypothetical protein
MKQPAEPRRTRTATTAHAGGAGTRTGAQLYVFGIVTRGRPGPKKRRARGFPLARRFIDLNDPP